MKILETCSNQIEEYNKKHDEEKGSIEKNEKHEESKVIEID